MLTLVIDTCSELGSIALASGEQVLGFSELPPRSASASLLSEIASLLHGAGLTLQDVTAIGVVSGPGSFTGVRVGVACAKGLCEALNIPLAAVSRLGVLADAANLGRGVVVLSAGRGELYALNAESGAERLLPLEEVRDLLDGGVPVVCAEDRTQALLAEAKARLVPLSAVSAISLVATRLRDGADDVGSVDANYVRTEQQIYGRANHATA